MTRTSKALRRLGVAGVVAATIGAGVPAFFATAASAASASLTLTPSADTAQTTTRTTANAQYPQGVPASSASGRTCNPFTLTAANNPNTSTPPTQSKTYDVTITQSKPAVSSASADTSTATIGFCDARTSIGDYPNERGATPLSPQPTDPTQPPGSSVNYGSNACQGTPATTALSSTTTCTAQVTTDDAGNVTFGVFSDSPGQMSINAFEDINGNNIREPLDQPQASATKTLVTSADDSVASLNCTPPSQVQPNSNNDAFDGNGQVMCVAKDAAGHGVYGAQVSFTVTSGPDKFQTGDTNSACYAPANGNTYSGSYNYNTSQSNSNPGQVPPTGPGQAAPRADSNYYDAANNTKYYSLNSENSTAGTDNTGAVVCNIYNQSGNPGTDTVVLYPGTVQSGGAARTQTVSVTFSGDARNIKCAANPTSTTTGSVSTTTCTVSDVYGTPVVGKSVQLTLTGVGRFTDGSTVQYRTSDANGKLTVTSTAGANEAGSQTITAVLGTGTGSGFVADSSNTSTTNPNECQRATGTSGTSSPTPSPTTAGNCQDAVTITYAAASTSPTPTATATVTVTPTTTTTATAPAGRARTTLTVQDPDIQPGQVATLVATGTPGVNLTLRCYTRPSTTYFDARPNVSNANGTVDFHITPGENTRCFVKYADKADSDPTTSPSVVVNVHTTLSLSTVRTGTRTYVFQGRNLPRLAGQLITLYRVDSTGHDIRTSNLVTDSSGIYRVTRTFTGTGTFQFRVRTSQTNTNAAGVSNTITVNIH